MINSEILSGLGINPSIYESLSPEEKSAVEVVLSEISMTGSQEGSRSFEELYYSDYDEIPVDFITFITDDQYLGKSTRNGQFLYPFWKKEAIKIFDANCVEVALSGSIGIGKTTAADVMIAYHLYRTMCLRDPQAFFNLSPGSKIAYAFLNNTLSSSYGVGYETLQSFLRESPWFLKHGKLVGRGEPYYYPEKGFEFIVGSRPQHTLGRHVICLSGDTEIVTDKGVKTIGSLEDQCIRVFSYDEQGNKVLSDECTVKQTATVTELFEIELEDGTVLKCTPEHKFLLKNGTYKMAKDLSEDDELVECSLFN